MMKIRVELNILSIIDLDANKPGIHNKTDITGNLPTPDS
jgi:hypothetical protein